MSKSRHFFPLALSIAFPLAVATDAVAQVDTQESLARNAPQPWVRSPGGSWSDSVPDTTSDYGFVDVMNSANAFFFRSNPITLSPGNYVANCRVQKFQDANGTEPIDFFTTINGNAHSVRLEVADQVVDRWVNTPSLLFSLDQQTTLTFQLSNLDGASTKQNYKFDWGMIGKIPLSGEVVLEERMLDWSHSWGAPYFLGRIPDPGSPFGFVDNLDHVWWFDMASPMYTLPAGVYTANLRAKLRQGGTAAPLDFIVEYNGASKTVVWDVNDQVPDRFTHTPNLTFELTAPTQVRFKFWDIASGALKSQYSFDTVTVRNGGLEKIGDGCPSTLGPSFLGGRPPNVGGDFYLRAQNVPTHAFLLFGVQTLNFDLTPLGAPNCTLYTSSDVTLVAPANARHRVVFTFPIANDPTLIGARWTNQALVPDPAANALQVVLSEAWAVTVGN